MSITKAREIIEKPGCGLTVGILLVLVFAIGFVLQGQYGAQQAEQAAERSRTPIATVGDFTVLEEAVRMRASYLGVDRATHVRAAEINAEALVAVVYQGLVLELAKEKGIKASQADIKVAVERQVETDFDNMARELNLPREQFEQLVKEKEGKSLDELMKENIEARLDQLQTDKDLRDEMTSVAVSPMLTVAEAKTVKSTPEQVRKANAKYVLKPIAIEKPDGMTALQKAAKVLSEIRGGLDYDAAMNKYSAYPVAPDKKKSTAELEFTIQQIELDHSLSPLLKLKPGQVSDVLDLGGNPYIFKLAKIKELSKKEFEKNKQLTTDQYANALGSISLVKQLKKLFSRIKWQSQGYELLFQAGITKSDAEMAPDVRKAKLMELIKTPAMATDDLGQDALDAARLIAISEYWNSATPEEQKGVRKARIESLRDIAEGDMDLSLEMVDLLIAERDKEAGHFVLAAAQSNLDFDEKATANNKRILERFAKAKAAKLVSADEEKLIQDLLDQWKKDKAQDVLDKKKQAEEDRKIAEEDKKLREEDERARKAAEKAEKDKEKQKGNPQARPKTSTGGTPKSTTG